MLLAHPALAQSVSLDLGGGDRGAFTGKVIQLIALMTILSIAPGILVMVTSLHPDRRGAVDPALGDRSAQTTPPNMVLVSLAMFLTAFVMAPIFAQSYDAGIKPLLEQKIDEQTAFNQGVAPFQYVHAGPGAGKGPGAVHRYVQYRADRDARRTRR